MGALSALGRGTDLQGNRFTGLLDMIDGGGGGKSGDKFAGGGLLSMLGNLFAKPYEAQQRVEDIAARASTRSSSPKPILRPSPPVSGFDSQTVQDIAAANEDAYLKEAFGTPSVTPEAGPPMPANAMSPVMPNQPMFTYDEVKEQTLPTYIEAPVSRGGQRGGLLDYSGPTSRGGRRGERPLLYSGRSDYGMENFGPTYSGRGISVGGFSPTLYASMVDDLIAAGMGDFVDTADQATMMDLYSTYVQNGGNLYNG